MGTRQRVGLRLALGASVVGALGLAVACSTDERILIEDSPAGVCAWDRLSGQPRQGFQAGETFYLTDLETVENCSGTWRLSEAPSGSTASLIRGHDGFYRLTPLVAGRYVMTLDGGRTAATEAIEVLDPRDGPFHNYHYYPSRSLARVGKELWVANVQRPTLSRMDAETLVSQGEVLVGSWPVALAHDEARGVVLVAHKAGDTLGFVDVESGSMVDALWVGDEPSEIILSPDGARAYVSLGGEGRVAVVDLAQRAVLARIVTLSDPKALALNADGSTLFVAGHRTGQSGQHPYAARSVEDEKDIALLDTQLFAVTGYVLEVASTINSMVFDEERQALWIAATTNDTTGRLNDGEVPSFSHEVLLVRARPGLAEFIERLDISRSGKGPAVVLQGLARCGGQLWVASESSDRVVALAVQGLEEVSRYDIPGRPRAVLCDGTDVYVHGSQAMTVSRVRNGLVETEHTGAADPRSPELVVGQQVFSAVGEGPGANRSCSSCHVDGLSDGVVWNAGPFPNAQVTRPFQWLGGTAPIGWDGYVGEIKITGYVGGSTIASRPNTEQALALGAFVRSLVPPPAANGWTRRDGQMTSEAVEGQRIFQSSGCLGCHDGDLKSNLASLNEGITPGLSDVPSLVGAYRVGSWLKDGSGATLEAAVEAALRWLDREAGVDQVIAIARYLRELTARDFFLLHASVDDLDQVSGALPVVLEFSYPPMPGEANEGRVLVRDGQGEPLAMDVVLRDRIMTLTPQSPLPADGEYEIMIPAGFESSRGQKFAADRVVPFRTAAKASALFSGDYLLKFSMPLRDFSAGAFGDAVVDVPVQFRSQVTSGTSSEVALDYGQDLVFTTDFVVSGDSLRTRHLPVPAGPSFANGHPLVGQVQDEDGDGVIDLVSGETTISGPGFDVEGIAWRIERPADPVVPN